MNTYEINSAIENAREALNCGVLTSEFRAAVRTLIETAEEVIEGNKIEEAVSSLRSAFDEIREKIEAAQSYASDLDDALGEVYSASEEMEFAIDEMDS